MLIPMDDNTTENIIFHPTKTYEHLNEANRSIATAPVKNRQQCDDTVHIVFLLIVATKQLAERDKVLAQQNLKSVDSHL